MRELADGTLVMPIYREYPEPLRNFTFVIRSEDAGAT